MMYKLFAGDLLTLVKGNIYRYNKAQIQSIRMVVVEDDERQKKKEQRNK